MDRMVERQRVVEQYRDESRLDTRQSVWRDSADGRNPQEAVATAIRAMSVRRVLEVGCGTGSFAARLASENPQATVIATDRSERFVELTAARDLPVVLADVERLPFPDSHFDVVVAMWMLYHVADLDGGLAEIRRVLRPAGRLVAVTNGDEHLATLLSAAGGSPLVTRFSTENGVSTLRRHFGSVEQDDITTRAVFESHAHAVAYIATFDPGLAARLPYFEGSREDSGATSVFVAF